MGNNYLTVIALTKYINYKFEVDQNLKSVYVKGEISNFKRHGSGHFYFTLKDKEAQISCLMFSSNASKVKFNPLDGMKVFVKGDVKLYNATGSYQLYVSEMTSDGLGDLYIAYEQLKRELNSAGYFDIEHKKPIPKYPKAIAAITSNTGAAIRDITQTIKRRYPLAKLYIYPTLVQGEGAKESIVNSIEKANYDGLADVLIVGRGGGSIEDLWAFNERIVAMAIYNSQIPIISAVGHETDTTISDYVADLRAATPTAAAELATPDINKVISDVESLRDRLNKKMNSILENLEMQIANLDKRLILKSPSSLIIQEKNHINDLKRALNNNLKSILDIKGAYLKSLNYRFELYDIKGRINFEKEKIKLINKDLNDLIVAKLETNKIALAKLIEKLKILNPLNIMELGYTMVKRDGKIIKNSKELNKGDEIEINFFDGIKHAKVED